jgi:hypothetical protein
MNDAPKRGPGRPAKQTVEGSHLRKLQYDRERYHKLKFTCTAKDDDNGPLILPEVVGLVLPAPEMTSPPRFRSPKEPVM